MALQIRFENDNEWIVFLSGDLDINSSPELKAKVLEKYESDPKNITFNFSELNYLDSTGLGALISIYNNLKENHHRIRIRNLKKNVKKLFQITQLNQEFLLEEE